MGRVIVSAVIENVSIIIAVSITVIIMPVYGIIESLNVGFVASLDGLNIGAVVNGFDSVGC